jgi:hypothetical protein
MNQNIIGNYSVDLPERSLKEIDADLSLHLYVKAYHIHAQVRYVMLTRGYGTLLRQQ